jgi:hypothetical protein
MDWLTWITFRIATFVWRNWRETWNIPEHSICGPVFVSVGLFNFKQASSHHAVICGRQHSEGIFTVMNSSRMWRLPKLQVNWAYSLGVVNGASSTVPLRSVTMWFSVQHFAAQHARNKCVKSFGSNPGLISPGRPMCGTEVVWKHIGLLIRGVGLFVMCLWIFRKWDVRAWIGWIWLRIGTGALHLWMR